MELSPQQDRALKAVARWARQPGGQQVFRMFGYAGTGKTTLARYFAEGMNPEEVLFGAFTGKAALVLRQKGCAGATTLHSLIYFPKNRSRATLRELMSQLHAAEAAAVEAGKNLDEVPEIASLRRQVREERERSSRPAFDLRDESESAISDPAVKVLVVDEASMIDRKMCDDILSFGKKVLALGDPGQLPPPRGTNSSLTSEHPDVLLTEIHRQARDNPILELATRARERREIPLGRYGESEVIDQRGDLKSRIMKADQLLVGRNLTRRRANNQSRRILERTGKLPEEGDKLVCLRNDKERGLMNGSLWRVVEEPVHSPQQRKMDLVLDSLDFDDEYPLEVPAWDHHFLGDDISSLGFFTKRDASEFDYGYALTVHKAQGSQWDDVVILDESHVFRAEAPRHLYTAITRAAERVTLVKGY